MPWFVSTPDQFNPPVWRKKPLLLTLGLAVVAAAVGVFLFSSALIELVDAVVIALREAGPVVFFLAMALLPAAGFPLLAFTLAAGPVFGPTLGTGWVIGWSLAAVVANLLLTYWLAHRALRPFVGWVLRRYGVPVPGTMTEGAWQITLIVRLTPGPPFWVQSYLLGLIRVPLVPYLVVSTAIMAGYIVALVCGGAAMAEGNGRLVAVAAGVLVVSIAVIQLLRQRTIRRRAKVLGPPAPQVMPAR